MSWLVVLAGLMLGFAAALPDSAEATYFDEVRKQTASDAEQLDRFGGSVAVDGDTAVVGADGEDTQGTDAGAAYVLQRDQGGTANWGEVTKLTASDAQAGDEFGGSVAVGGDTVVVGAFLEGAGGSQTGAAYIFERDEGGADNWGEVRRLTASDPQPGDQFGISVAVSGDTIVVGASLVDAGGSDTGASYIFRRDEGGAGNWGEVRKITASDAQAGDEFGDSVAVSGDTAVVGAWSEDAEGSLAGAAYVFQRDLGGADNWGEVRKLIASDAQTGDFFGQSVAISGDTVVVGAFLEDARGISAGASYIFRRDQGGTGSWGEVKKLTASDGLAGDQFGISVAVSGDTAVVGAFLHDSEEVDAGAAYVFQRGQGGPDNWGEVKKLIASDAEFGDFFGQSVAASDDTAVVGAFLEDAAGSQAGAVYIFGEAPASIVGDANGDSLVNSIDATLVLQFVADLLDSLASSADANANGTIDAIDAVLILQFVAGLLTNLPP